MSSLTRSAAIDILLSFESDWANLREVMNNCADNDNMLKMLVRLCEVRRQLCADKRFLRWYLLAGLKSLAIFYPATIGCAEWEGKTMDEINNERFKAYNNWTITTTSRWKLIQAAAGNANYDDWNFKHPLPPTVEELHRIMDSEMMPSVLRIGTTTHDLDWYCCL